MRFAAALTLLVAAPALALADGRPTWPQWRGPTRAGVTTGAPFPDNLTTLKQLWRVELGPGYSGPVVLADRVIVTESPDEKTEAVRALDRDTGKELWAAKWAGGQ